MLRFKEFLVEAFLIEGKIDDLKAQNPSLHHEIDAYAAADTSATKKFVPWLVSQHKKGNVTPDHPDLHQTIQNFDRYKNIHGIKDHSSESFSNVRDAVLPLVGKAATKREVAHTGRQKIHDSGDVQAYHIKSKEASQRFYGGGPEAGPMNTTWCVSARSPHCMFGDYGEMYTIHAKGDPNSPYAVHPERETITTRHNDGDKNIHSELTTNPSVAHIKPAIDAIQSHYDPDNIRHRLSAAHDLTPKEIDRAMSDPKLQERLFNNPHENVIVSVMNHPKATDNNLSWGAGHDSPAIALAALNRNHNNPYIVERAARGRRRDPKIVMAALNHPLANVDVTHFAAENRDPHVALAALNHPKADGVTIDRGVRHPDPHVVLMALHHPKSTSYTTYGAAAHPDPQIALAGLRHPRADHGTYTIGAQHSDAQVRSLAYHLLETTKR